MNVLLTIAMVWAEEAIEFRLSPTILTVRATPSTAGVLRGQIAENEPFAVLERVSGKDCGGDGWGRVLSEGFACLEATSITADQPVALPRLSTFDAPDPEDHALYLKTGSYPAAITPPLLPYIYGKRWKLWQGKVWESVESWQAGEPSADTLDFGHSYSFVGVVDTEKGRVFVRPNGSVVPASEVYIFPLTEFYGRDLVANPVSPGTVAAWVVGTGGAWIRTAPTKSSSNKILLSYHSELIVKQTALPGQWWEIPDALGAGIPGYISGTMIRHWVPVPRPAELGAAEVWLDIDLAQQLLSLMQGDTPLYTTLISSGKLDYDSPTGTFRIYDKSITNDMSSLSGADETYIVEDVPWVMHFKPRYAVHGAFWHWGFGQRASHGCINLSPRDARYIFDRIYPLLPNGFRSIHSTPAELGTLVSIRMSG